MFDHLDDPEPFLPGEAFHDRTVARGRARRRHRRLVGGGALAVALLVGSAVGALAYVDRRVDDIERVEVAGLASEPEPGEPTTVLFVGVDDDQEGSGARSDTIVLARVDPDRNVLSVLPLPRDLWVDVPGHGPSRINAAMTLGGPDLLIRTIEADLEVEVNHYVQVDMEGAARIGDALGGIRLAFAHPVRDLRSGLDLPVPGCATFDGAGALAVARTRHLQALVDGRWRSDPTSDLSRIERAQAIAAALFERLAGIDAGDVRELTRFVDAFVDAATIDQGLTRDGLVDLARGISGADVRQLRLGVSDATHGGAQVLEPAPGSEQVLAAFAAGDPMPAPAPTAPDGTPGTVGPTWTLDAAFLPVPC